MATQEELAVLFGDTASSSEPAGTISPRDKRQDELAVLFGDKSPEEVGFELDPQISARRPSAEEDTGFGLGRKLSIGVGETLEAAAETLEFLPKTIAGAVDEANSLLGITKPGEYPLQEGVDSFLRFDEIARQIVPKEKRIPETSVEQGLAAVSRGAGSVLGFTGPAMMRGAKTLTSGTAPLTTGQRATIASGETLRTPGSVATQSTLTSPQTAPTFSQQLAARPGQTLATEGAVIGGAGLGAAGGAEIGGEEGAAIGEIAGIVTGALSPAAWTVLSKGPTGRVFRWLAGKSEPARETMHNLFDREAFAEAGFWTKADPRNWKSFLDEQALEKYARRDVLKHLDALLPTAGVEDKVRDRIAIVAKLQEIDPNFNPSLGAIIGTPESKAFQQVVDFQNPELALEMHDKNMKAMKNIRNLIAKDPSAKFGDDLADIFEVMSKDTQILLENMETRMQHLSGKLMDDALEGVGDPTEEAILLRDHMKNMQNVYDKIKDDMYGKIDVPKNVKFKVDELDALVTDLNRAANPDSVVGSGIKTLERILPAALKESGEVGKRTMDYETLNSFRSRLGKELADLRSNNPHSPFLKTLEDVRSGIDQIIDGGIDALPESMNHIKKAREDARAFFRDEYTPRFRTGTLSDMQARNNDGTMRLADDALMAKFWQQGDKTTGAKDFKRLFENYQDGMGRVDQQGLAILREEAEGAQASLERYAMNTLRVDLMNAAKAEKDPNAVLNAWRKKYRGALDQFPSIANKTENIETVFSEIAEQHKQFAAQRDFLSRNVINKYLQTDPERVIKDFMSSPRTANRILNTIDSLYSHDPSKIKAIRDALEVSVVNNIINSAERGGEFKYKAIAKMMEDGSETLPLLMGSDNYNKLVAFNKGLGILDDQPELLAKAELNKLSELLKEAGVSPASILSRYYSASLGKVGPVYLATDAATRFLTKRSEAYFKNLYKELMYDPNTLENLNTLLNDAIITAEKSKVPPEVARRMALLLSSAGIKLNDSLMDDQEAPEEIYTGGGSTELPDQEALAEEPVTRTGIYDPETGVIEWQ